jgi:hypothetical protein
VWFNIGELEVSLSREQLQYTKHSLDQIRQKLEIVYNEIYNRIHAIVDSASDGLHYRELIISAAEKVFANKHASQIFDFVKGNQYNVKDRYDLQRYSFTTKELHNLKVSNGRSVSTLTTKFSCWKSNTISLEKDLSNVYTVSISLFDLHKIKIYVRDCRDAVARVRAVPGQYSILVDKNFFPKELQRLVSKASSLPKAVRAQKSAGRVISDIFSIQRNSFSRIQLSDITSSKKKVYVEFKDARQKDTMKKEHLALYNLFSSDHEIYLLAIREGKAAPKGFISIEEYAREFVAKYNTKKFVEEQSLSVTKHDLGYNYSLMRLYRMDFATPYDSAWNKFRASLKATQDPSVKSYSDIRAKYTTMIAAAEFLKIEVVGAKEAIAIDKIEKALYNVYEMLKFADAPSEAAVKNYVTLIGK